MNPEAHQKCQNRENCAGPGCRVYTGKTARKANFARPKPNQHEGSRISSTGKKAR